MKSALAAGVAALSLFDIAAATTASAQDGLPTFQWTGFYVGSHAGGRWADTTFKSNDYITEISSLGGGTLTFPDRDDRFGLDSGIAGVHLGYNVLFGPSWLVGAEGDFTWGWGNDSVSDNFSLDTVEIIFGDAFAYTVRADIHSQVDLNWQSTLRARLGYVSGTWLFYWTAGVAFIDLEWRETVTVKREGVGSETFRHKEDETKVGVAIGGGIEKAISDLWLVRAEYLYESFGGTNVPHGAADDPAEIGRLSGMDVQKVRFGISRKFGVGG